MSHESSDRNKQLVRSVYETCINERRLELLSRLVGERFAGPGGRGPAGFAKNVEDLITAFPDIRFTIKDVIGEGSRVAVRWAWVGTHRSPFRGIPATNKTVTNTGIAIYEIEEDRIVGNWLETDRLGVLQAISAVPQSFAAGQ